MKVEEIMTTNVTVTKKNDLLTNARAILRKTGYRMLPVVDDENRVIGVIGRSDVLRIASSKTNLTVGSLMKKPVTATPNSDLVYVARQMVDNSIRQVAIVDKENKLLGIVSSLDVLKGLIKGEYKIKKNFVEEIMNKDVLFCYEDDDVSRIWRVMLNARIGGIPVVKKKGKKNIVVGFVTMWDMIKKGFRMEVERGKYTSMKISKVMQSILKYLHPEDKISDVIDLMLKNRIIRVPIVDKEKNLVGIVDIEDVLRAYLE
ncbi:MAG: HPP family protein [Candidatus Altarchaeaceae archaeon]